MPDELPHGIVFIRRTRMGVLVIAILLAIAILALSKSLHLFGDALNNVRKPNSGGRSLTTLLIAIQGFYFIAGLHYLGKLKPWIYRRYGGFRKEDFVKVIEGKGFSSWPGPKVFPVWVTVAARCASAILIAIIPGVLFGLFGWHSMQFTAMLLFLFCMADLVSAFYYVWHWDKNMVEYIKPSDGIGIDHFDIYFFPKDQTDLAMTYIEEIRRDLKKAPLPGGYLT